MDFILAEPIQLTDDEKAREIRPHEGLFYRAKLSSYYSHSSGIFHKRTTLTPLKRKSCKGCPTCDAIHEMVSECSDEIDGFMEKIESGKMYELKIEGSKQWTDCGYEYDCWLELNEVKNEL